jgi:hypothetical protein
MFHELKIGNAIPAQSVTEAVVQGAVIVRPWEQGRQLALLFNGGAFGTAASGRLRVMGRRESDAGFEAVLEADGVTPLEFDVADLDDAGAGENGVLIGTLDFRHVDTEKFDALRFDFEAETASVAQLIAATYAIGDLYAKPSGTSDQLYYKLTGFTTP